MLALLVTIVRWADDWQPGWVECHLMDAFDRRRVFIEKVPVVSREELHADTAYPRPGLIACTLIERRIAPTGREVLVVDTATPWGIESTTGETRFEVHPTQVVQEVDV